MSRPRSPRSGSAPAGAAVAGVRAQHPAQCVPSGGGAAGPDASSDIQAVVQDAALAVWEAGRAFTTSALTSTIKVLAALGGVGVAIAGRGEDKTPWT